MDSVSFNSLSHRKGAPMMKVDTRMKELLSEGLVELSGKNLVLEEPTGAGTDVNPRFRSGYRGRHECKIKKKQKSSLSVN